MPTPFSGLETIHANRYLTPSMPMDAQRLSAWEFNQVHICACQNCARLLSWRTQAAKKKTTRKDTQQPTWWNKPVPGFGDPFARLMVVGISPGIFGSNRTGRIFTGDGSGDFLFSALYEAGFSNQPDSEAFGDGLNIRDVYITSVCKCTAPRNRAYLYELESCQSFLEKEIGLLDHLEGIIVLGQVAFERILTIFRSKGAQNLHRKGYHHNQLITPGNSFPWILSSYHPSPQNTQTGRLNKELFTPVWKVACDLLIDPPIPPVELT